MLNNIIYYYVLFIIILISLNLLIKLSKYLYFFIRNKYLYKGSKFKSFELVGCNNASYTYIFTPRSSESIFGNYFNMLQIVLNDLYQFKSFKNNLYLIFFLYDKETKLYTPLSNAMFLDLVNKHKAITIFTKIKWNSKAYEINNFKHSIVVIIKNNKSNNIF